MAEMQELRRELEITGVMEELKDISIHQEGKYRIKYLDIATEALSTSTGKARLIQKLYDDIVAKKNFDTNEIDDTAGNITKLKNYNTTMEAIDAINRLYESSPSKTVKMMNEMSEYLVSYRSDYEYAYKTGNDVLQTYYQISVFSLMELINYCAAEYVSGLRDSVATVPGLTTKPGKKFLSIANKVLKVYRSGAWINLVNSFKKEGSKSVIQKSKYKVANESFGDGLMRVGQGLIGASGFVSNTIGTGLGKLTTAIVALGMIAVASAALFGVVMLFLSAMRLAVYWFFSTSAKLSDYWTTQANILEFNIESNKSINNSKKELKLKKLKDRVNFINAKILKTEKIMDTELSIANREQFGAEELREFSSAPVDDSDIAFF